MARSIPAADYRGARGSNAGDQFHELWALQNILALLQPNTSLTAVGVEGVKTETTEDDASAAWDGVDCAMYFGGSTLETATRVEFAQLKYSGSTPCSSWTAAKLCENTKQSGNNSVVRRLADAYRKAKELRRRGAAVSLKLVSNQPLGADVKEVVAAPTISKTDTSALLSNRQKIKDASGLGAKDFPSSLLRSILANAERRLALRKRRRPLRHSSQFLVMTWVVNSTFSKARSGRACCPSGLARSSTKISF